MMVVIWKLILILRSHLREPSGESQNSLNLKYKKRQIRRSAPNLILYD